MNQMMNSVIASAIAFTSVAHAFVPDHLGSVNVSGLTIAGSGVGAKHSDDSIALACTDDSCGSLAFVYFHQNSKAYFFGPTFEGVDSPTDREGLSRRVREIADEMFVLKNVEHRKYSRTFWFLLLGTAASIPLAPLTTTPFMLFFGADILLALSNNQTEVLRQNDFIGAIKNKKVTRVMKKKQGSRVFLDQRGWNWSENPKKVKRFKFCLAVAALDHPEYMDDQAYIKEDYSHAPASHFRNEYINRCMEGLNE